MTDWLVDALLRACDHRDEAERLGYRDQVTFWTGYISALEEVAGV